MKILIVGLSGLFGQTRLFLSRGDSFCARKPLQALQGQGLGAVAPQIYGPTPVLGLANTDETEPARFLGLANEFILEADGWALIPYGESRHSGKDGRQPDQIGAANAKDSAKPVIQRFDRASADDLVVDFNSPLSRFKRFVVGLPIFKGHPDAPRWAKHFPDKMPRGTISQMEATDRGLRLKPVLTEQGAELVTKEGWSAFSPYWRSIFKEMRDGVAIYSPDKLWSLGLLPPGRENISGLSLANAAEPQPGDSLENPVNENHMNPLLIKILAAMGVTVAANATEAQVAPSVDQVCGILAAANAKETELTTLKADKVRLEKEVADNAAAGVLALANAKTELETRATKAETALKNERAARAKLVVVGAVKSGRVSAAELDAQSLALANAADFDAAVALIEKLPRKLKTQSTVGGLGKDNKEGQSRHQTVLNLVNARMETPEIKALPAEQRYDAAWSAVEKDPAHAAIFEAMKPDAENA